jgi:hypothetical protein
VTTDPGQYCQACNSGTTYWAFSTVEGDVWYCGSCGYQWMVEVVEMITESSTKGAGKGRSPTRVRRPC